jgi:hypothetical protein
MPKQMSVSLHNRLHQASTTMSGRISLRPSFIRTYKESSQRRTEIENVPLPI